MLSVSFKCRHTVAPILYCFLTFSWERHNKDAWKRKTKPLFISIQISHIHLSLYTKYLSMTTSISWKIYVKIFYFCISAYLSFCSKSKLEIQGWRCTINCSLVEQSCTLVSYGSDLFPSSLKDQQFINQMRLDIDEVSQYNNFCILYVAIQHLQLHIHNTMIRLGYCNSQI